MSFPIGEFADRRPLLPRMMTTQPLHSRRVVTLGKDVRPIRYPPENPADHPEFRTTREVESNRKVSNGIPVRPKHAARFDDPPVERMPTRIRWIRTQPLHTSITTQVDRSPRDSPCRSNRSCASDCCDLRPVCRGGTRPLVAIHRILATGRAATSQTGTRPRFELVVRGASHCPGRIPHRPRPDRYRKPAAQY